MSVSSLEEVCFCGLGRWCLPGGQGLRLLCYEKGRRDSFLNNIEGPQKDGLLRGLLLYALGEGSFPPIIREPRSGKPRFRSDTDLYFNVSHSDRHFLLGLAHDTDIGVDIETPEAGAAAASAWPLFLSREEAAQVVRDGAADPDLALRYWTVKEAAAKLNGDGIYADFRSIDLSFLALDEDTHLFAGGRWFLRPSFGKRAVAAVAAYRRLTDIKKYIVRCAPCCGRKFASFMKN